MQFNENRYPQTGNQYQDDLGNPGFHQRQDYQGWGNTAHSQQQPQGRQYEQQGRYGEASDFSNQRRQDQAPEGQQPQRFLEPTRYYGHQPTGGQWQPYPQQGMHQERQAQHNQGYGQPGPQLHRQSHSFEQGQNWNQSGWNQGQQQGYGNSGQQNYGGGYNQQGGQNQGYGQYSGYRSSNPSEGRGTQQQTYPGSHNYYPSQYQGAPSTRYGESGDVRDFLSDSYGSENRRGQHSGRAPKSYKRTDDRIQEDIYERLTSCDIDCTDITCNVKDGEVSLSGTVQDRRNKFDIEHIADGVTGVRDINNQIRVDSNRAQWQQPSGIGSSEYSRESARGVSDLEAKDTNQSGNQVSERSKKSATSGANH